ncbi:ferric reductase like transmembrane component-domain-containing protein [Annulohypoxylon maeteangense]|uniref:ferric reductase like transmembrane component-domain-containing protein n=1 Tax=Annulohypoxylon maeteangense TaxID=1927788 RepID=UPI0020073DAF|nr:ferric reductase like transmembrane component-domain-containing protein [Annulohypoxylon maeteangense]KAI0886235.1 ferric reductase like transmembrane component-domain-containing protein [Annulohypoxylon maeteangense]
MSFIRRRIADALCEAANCTATLEPREAPTATGDAAATPSSTIAPFSTALNGVDQDGNMLFRDSLWWTLGGMALILLTIRLVTIGWSQLRHVSAMSATGAQQTYWKKSQWSWMPAFKKNLLYAPLWKKRHNREIKLSSAVTIGTLPSRLHSVILAIYILSNVGYMFYEDWFQENRYALAAQIRGRSGTLSLVNMVPLLILAGRNNPLISLLHVSFDTYNLIHRSMGRTVVIEAIIHTIAWAYVEVAASGWSGMGYKLVRNDFLASGFVGTIALTILLILAVSPLRHAFYETFLNFHIVLGMISLVMTYLHCHFAELPGGLPQKSWVVAIFASWVLERTARVFRLGYYNWSKRRGFTEAEVEVMPGDTTRVTMHLPRYMDIKPGSHAYLRFSQIKIWETHPFSVAWVKHHPNIDRATLGEKAITEAQLKKGTTSVSFVIGAHTGFTRALYNRALGSGSPSIRLRAAIEGPYAGHHSLNSYGHVLLFAGSTGITHQISFLKPLIEGFNDGTVATRRITLVWIMRDTESLEWVRPWMDEILRIPRRREVLAIRLFVTRPKNSREIHSGSSTVQMFPGRPKIATLVKKEVEEQVGAMCVTVCGPGALADDVRQAVREVQDGTSVVDFIEESFTW